MVQWSREFGFEHTFLISMYRSSGISGARPVSCLSVSRDQAEASRQTSRYGPRHQEWGHSGSGKLLCLFAGGDGSFRTGRLEDSENLVTCASNPG